MPAPTKPACLLALLLCGCAAGPELRDMHVGGKPVELAEVPYLADEGYRGGPAATAMALAASGVRVAPGAFDGAFERGEQQSNTRASMVQAVASQGRVPYLLKSRQVDLDAVREVQSGHAVVVLLKRGLMLPDWQYAVMVGVDPAENQFALRTGSQRRLVLRYGALLSAWRDSGYWALLVARPDDIPATAVPAAWLAGAAALAQAGKLQESELAYRTATQRWPQQASAWADLGRVRHSLHDLNGAIEAYAAALRLQANDAAVHADLAQSLGERQCSEQAEDEIGKALALERDPGRRAVYERFRREMAGHSGPSVFCPVE